MLSIEVATQETGSGKQLKSEGTGRNEETMQLGMVEQESIDEISIVTV